MNEATQQTWQLLRQSQLIPNSQIENLAQRFQAEGINGEAASVVKWLVAQKLVTAYQGQVLAAGRSGPFLYGEYKVYDRVNGGTFDGCFRAIHATIGHPVLLKFLTGAAVTDHNVWNAIFQEVKIQASVSHPNLLRCFDLADLGTYKFLVLEDRHGTPVSQTLATGKRFDPVNACHLIQSAAIGLQAIHLASQVHAHLTADCLYLGSDGTSWVYRDPLHPPFNPMQATADPKSLELADYVAPELGAVGSSPNVLTDIYSLGCLFYELLSGKKPFPDGDLRSKISRHATAPTEPLESLGVSAGIEQLVRFMMAKDPSVRYRSMDTVANQLVPFSQKPAVANPINPSKTLQAFEQHLAQRGFGAQQPAVQRVQASSAPVVPRPVASAPAVNIATGGPQVAQAPVVSATSPIPASAPTSATAPPPIPNVSPAPVGNAAGVAAPTSRVTERLQKKRGPSLATWVGLAIALLLMIPAAILVFNVMNADPSVADNGQLDENDPKNGGDSKEKVNNSNNDTKDNSDPKAKQQDGVFAQNLVADNGHILWETPTVGLPIELDYVPEGMRALVSARPSKFAAASGGDLVLLSLGEDFEKLRTQFEAIAGVELSRIEHLLMTFHDNPGKAPQTSCVITLAGPMSKENLLAKWQNPKPTPLEGKNLDYYAATGEVVYFIPPEGLTEQNEVKQFVMTNGDLLKSMAATDFSPPRINTSVAQMLKLTDGDRHFTALSTPAFLGNEQGEQLFDGERKPILDSIKWLIDPEIQAGLVSMHLDGDWYLELMLKGPIDRDAHQMGKDFIKRLEAGSNLLAKFLRSFDKNEYWDAVRFAFHPWMQQLLINSRTGVEDNIMIANCWMPGPAAHNLLAGTELILASRGGGGGNVATTEVAVTEAPKTIEELLNVPWEIDVPENDMVLSIGELKDGVLDAHKNLPFHFDIVMMGNDLKDGGITQNRKIINFKMQGKLHEVLTAMMMTALGDKLVTEPSDVNQKLIWVIGPDPNKPEEKAILITTRKAAARDKIELPAAFQLETE